MFARPASRATGWPRILISGTAHLTLKLYGPEDSILGPTPRNLRGGYFLAAAPAVIEMDLLENIPLGRFRRGILSSLE